MNSPEFNHFKSLEANSFDALFACSSQEWRQNLELDGKEGADQSTGAGLYGARRVAPEKQESSLIAVVGAERI